MHTTEKKNQHLRQAKKKIILSLVVNLVVPWILYTLLHSILNNDTILLVITTSIPIIRTVSLWIWRHQTDWIGVIGAFSFAIALIVSMLYEGNPLPLKLIHPIIFGVIGLAFLIPVIIGKPLLFIIVKALRRIDNEENFNSNNILYKKFTIMTVLFGGISLTGSIIHIAMALTVSTSTFIIMSQVVSFGTILTLIISGKFVVTRFK